jgi:glycosyltransferase involved in cell wall biosynthesis
VFRVVERTALALAERTDIQLEFSALSSPRVQAMTLDYVAQIEKLRGVSFPHNSTTKRLIELAGRLYETPDEDRRGLARYRRSLGNRSFMYLERGLQAISPMVTPSQLRWADVVHSPSQPFNDTILRSARACFMTIYDMTPFVVPQYHVEATRAFMSTVLTSVQKGAWPICISEATRTDLLQVCPDLDPSRTSVAYLAADESFAPCTDAERLRTVRAKYQIGDAPFFLCVNTLEPRKNVEAVIRCFAKIVAQEQLHDAQLVLAGPRGWLSERLDAVLKQYGDSGSRVIVTGFVDEADLAPLYSAARAFVYVSHYEGFGLPPLEAMQCGVPVIASNTSSLPEVVGDAGLQVDPTDDDAICDGMLRLWRDTELCGVLREKGLAKAKTFSWAASAEAIVGAYRKAI